LNGLVGQVLDLTVIFNPWLLLAIFLITLVGEFSFSIPLFMETVWLFTGYGFAVGHLTIENLVLFITIAIIGRTIGSSILFYLSWYGKTSVAAPVYAWCKPRLAGFLDRVPPLKFVAALIGRLLCWIVSRMAKPSISEVDTSSGIRLFGRTFRLSPFTVALGRLAWLRIPLTVGLGTSRQRTLLFLGVVLSSLFWDGAYIAFGVLGGKSGLDQVQMLFYPIMLAAVVSGTVFGIRKLRRYIASRRERRLERRAATSRIPLPMLAPPAMLEEHFD
jgi:hypothetical protein